MWFENLQRETPALAGCGKTQSAVILSEAKNLSLFLFIYLNRREIIPCPQYDKTRQFFRSLLVANVWFPRGRIWLGPAMKLVGPLAARSPGLRLALLYDRMRWALEIERHCSADEILQGRLIDLFAFLDVDGAPDIPVEAGIEQTYRVFQRSSLGKRHLDDVLVRLSRADDSAVGKDGSARRCRLHPLPLFDDLWGLPRKSFGGLSRASSRASLQAL